MKSSFRRFVFLLPIAAFLAAPPLWACACGCGVFDVQDSAIPPASQAGGVYPLQNAVPSVPGAGGLISVQYGNVNQNQNWSHSKSASNEVNGDKLLRTDFITVGGQAMFGEWGIMAEVPVWNRLFKTLDDEGNLGTFHDLALADVRLRGVYAGFSPDMATGVTFGAKLPTGNFKAAGFDRDSQIGTGSTDLLLGAYRLGRISGDGRWTWFGNVSLDQPVLIGGGYRPGTEVDALAGASFLGWSFGGMRTSPFAQLIGTARGRDAGALAHSGDTGYTRLLAGPGLHLADGHLLIDFAVSFPVAQNVNGNQLMAPRYWKAGAGWRF